MGSHMKKRTFFLVILCCFLAAAFIRINNNFRFAPACGYDANGHLSYIYQIKAGWGAPLANEGWSTFHPPLYYYTMSWLWKFLGPKVPSWPMHILFRLFSTVLNLGMAALVLLSIALLWPGDFSLSLLGLCFVLFVPLHIYTSSMIGNEQMVAFLTSLGLWLLILYDKKPRLHLHLAALMGIVCGLALLSKYTGVLLFMTITICLVSKIFSANAEGAMGCNGARPSTGNGIDLRLPTNKAPHPSPLPGGEREKESALSSIPMRERFTTGTNEAASSTIERDLHLEQKLHLNPPLKLMTLPSTGADGLNPGSRREHCFSLAIVLVGCCLLAGGFYARNIALFGHPFALSQEYPYVNEVMSKQPPGERRWTDFVGFDLQIFRDPIIRKVREDMPYARSRYVWTLVYSNFWFESFSHFFLLHCDFWRQRLGKILLLLGILPTLLLGIEIGKESISALRQKLNTPTSPLLVLFFLNLSSFTFFNLKTPHYSAGKASYFLVSTLPLAIFMGRGMQRWLQQGKICKTIGLLLLICIFGLSCAAFFLTYI